MPDLRRKRLISLFLVNVASGVATIVIVFFGVVFTGEHAPFLSLLILVGVPAASVSIWRSDLEQRGRERDLTKRVAWQAFRVLIAWEAVALVVTGFFIFFATSAMAPVPHSHDTAGMAFLIVTPAAVLLALWFTWVRSRRMLDLLWPPPGMPQPGSESPFQQLNL